MEQDSILCSPLVSSTMSNRFQQFMSFLRFYNFGTREARKRTIKSAAIRHIFDCFYQIASLHLAVHWCVDEQLVLFRSKAIEIYMKSKPEKYGLKCIPYYRICNFTTKKEINQRKVKDKW